jgi:DNA polymerase III subunit epsilon
MSTNQSTKEMPQLNPLLEEGLLKAFPDGVIALDLETTGLSPLIDKIIEVSAVKITQREGHIQVDYFDELIDPKITIPEKTIAIHGITDEMVKGKPSIQEIFPKFLDWIEEIPLIAHNAKFDLGFLMYESHESKLKTKDNMVFCSCQYARVVLPKQSCRLKDLTDKLGIKLVNHHRALDDAMACLEVFGHGILHRSKSDQGPALKKGLLFSLAEFDKPVSMAIPEHLELLEQNVMDQNILMIQYQGGSHKGKLRPIRPISLLPMPLGSILYAHCLLSDLYKFFALRKIKEVVQVSEKQKKTIEERLKTLKKPS